MKRILLFLALTCAAFAQTIPTVPGVYSLTPGSSGGGGSGTVTSVSFTGGIITVTNPTTTPAMTIAGTSGGIVYFDSSTTWASSAVLAANAFVLGGGAGVAPSTTTTAASVVSAVANATNAASGLVALNSNSTLTLPGALIRTPATITVTAGAGTIDVTKGYSQASVVATTTLTPSAAGTAGQFCVIDITTDSTQRVVTVDTAVDFSVTCPPSLTTTLLMRSTGSGWVLVGGSPSLVDATADTTPATTKIMATVDPTTGVAKKSTIAQIMAAANLQVGALADGMTGTTQAARSADTKLATDAYANAAGNGQNLGSWASPDTTAGSITWANAPVYIVWTSASGGARTYTLPSAVGYGGKAIILTVVAGTNNVNIKPASGEKIILDGTQLAADHKVQFTTSAAGNRCSLISDNATWEVFSVPSGTLVDGGT